MQKTKVLIIGAGPTGLMAAGQLSRHGIEFIIIDKKNGPTKESRALVLHARTLEIYDQMGIANDALVLGNIVQKVQIIVESKKIQMLKLNKLGEGLSPFPFLLVLEQSKNEELLYQFLLRQGVDVLWNHEMVSIVQEEDKVVVVVRNGDETIDIEPDYVIAADGSKSDVRESMEIPFLGGTYENIFFVADTALQTDWDHEALTVYLSKQTFLGLFPMQGNNRFRVIGILPQEYQNENPESFEEITPFIQKQVTAKLKFSDTAWFSIYRLHHRWIENFRDRRIFFAGDAAHIHSPAGGQGMNTGIQDAYNLVWKLAFTINGNGSSKLLDTYNLERLPFARQLVQSTDRAFDMATSGKWYHKIFRLQIVPLLLPFLFKFKKYRLRGFRTVSQIGIKYISSDLTVNRVVQVLKIKAGDRFPYLTTQDGNNVYDLMREPVFHAVVICLGGENKLIEEIMELEKELPGVLKVVDLCKEKKMIQKLKIKKDTVILVRPDHYIGLITDEGARVVGDYL
ncbi:MAG TPA: FAD-dependent monooxygenase, partial [Chitinophagaceae bacterium]|nr:FAD-dependent monooxygenase [Chitinophagaceae bacterium]